MPDASFGLVTVVAGQWPEPRPALAFVGFVGLRWLVSLRWLLWALADLHWFSLVFIDFCRSALAVAGLRCLVQAVVEPEPAPQGSGSTGSVWVRTWVHLGSRKKHLIIL